MEPPALAQTTTSAFTVNPVVVGVGAIIFGMAAGYVWSNKGGQWFVGFLWGFLLGLIGLIVVAIAKPKQRPVQLYSGQQYGTQQAALPMRACPYCGQQFQSDQSICPNCKQSSPPWRQERGFWVTKDESGREWRLDQQGSSWVLYRMSKFCPHCKAEMQPDQSTCPECGQESNAITYPV